MTIYNPVMATAIYKDGIPHTYFINEFTTVKRMLRMRLSSDEYIETIPLNNPSEVFEYLMVMDKFNAVEIEYEFNGNEVM